MCQQVIQFCSGSARPLLLAGGLLSSLLALAIGYTGCTTNSLLVDISPQVAGQHALAYYLQLAAAGYLALVTLFSCYAAHYDEKHSIRALAFITSLNFVLALVAIFMMPQGVDLISQFKGTLMEAQSKYNYTEKYPKVVSAPPQVAISGGGQEADVSNSTAARQKRLALSETSVNEANATRIWDRLQERGCCGLNNGTDWKLGLPKSCCSPEQVDESKETMIVCKQVGDNNQRGCLQLIGSTSTNLLIVLSLIALVNFYLALIASIGAYRTLHYDEASQSAYT